MKAISSDSFVSGEKINSHIRQKSSLLLSSSMEISSSSDKPNLVNHKTFLNKLLNIIKISQIDFLSNKKKFDNKSSNKILLTNLKIELFNILNENTLIKASIQNEVMTKRKILQKQIFGEELNLNYSDDDNKNSNNLNDNYFLESENVNSLKNIENNTYSSEDKSENIKSKRIKKSNKLLLIEQAENNLYYSTHIELYHLKLLNFKIENQIDALNNKISQRTYVINCMRTFAFDSEFIPRIYCTSKADIDKAHKILYNNSNYTLKTFREVVKAKNKVENDIIETKTKIENIEISYYNLFNKGTKKYIETKDIIDEESREYTKSITFSIKNTNNFNTNESKKSSITNIININNINNIININMNSNDGMNIHMLRK